MQVNAIEQALEKVLSSRAFRRAGRLRCFLEYVVRRSLAGDEARLKEASIGIDVFDRGGDFDPRIDTIVRVEAIKLRERLLAYYRTEGATDPIAISIPKGAYRPVFQAQDICTHPILDDPEALYWSARSLFLLYDPKACDRARRLLLRGVARWPDDARLHAVLAESIALSLCSDIGFLAPDEGLPLLRWAATRARSIDPDCAEAAFYLKLADIRQPDKMELLSVLGRAISNRADDANLHQWAAAILTSIGRPEEGLLHMRQAARMRPGTTLYDTYLATFLFAAGRVDAATGHLKDVLAVEPEFDSANFWMGRALCSAGRFDDAAAVAGRAYAVSNSARSLALLGFAHAAAGNRAASDAIVGKLEARAKTDYVPPSLFAPIHIAAGKLERAADEARRAFREGDFQTTWLAADSRCAPLRGCVAGL